MAEAKKISVRLKYGISHDGVQYNPGDKFECPADAYDSLKECFDTSGSSQEEAPTPGDTQAPEGDVDLTKFWNSKKVEEIKAELKTRGLEFPDDGKKAELIEILVGSSQEEAL